MIQKSSYILSYLLFLGSLDAHQMMESMQRQGVKVRLLDLKRGDIRPGLARLRNDGIYNFVVDIGAEYLKLFFEEVSCHIFELEITIYFFCLKLTSKNGFLHLFELLQLCSLI